MSCKLWIIKDIDKKFFLKTLSFSKKKAIAKICKDGCKWSNLEFRGLSCVVFLSKAKLKYYFKRYEGLLWYVGICVGFIILFLIFSIIKL